MIRLTKSQKIKSIFLLQHNRESYVEPFINFIASRNIISRRLLLTKKTTRGDFDCLKKASGLVIIDQPKDQLILEKSKDAINNFFQQKKPILGLGDVSDLCFKAIKIKVKYGEKVYGWNPVLKIIGPSFNNFDFSYPQKLLILGNKFFSSEINSNTFFIKILNQNFPILSKYRSLSILNYTNCMSENLLIETRKRLEYIPNPFRQTKEELIYQGFERLSLQNEFSKAVWDDWCSQLI